MLVAVVLVVVVVTEVDDEVVTVTEVEDETEVLTVVEVTTVESVVGVVPVGMTTRVTRMHSRAGSMTRER